MPTMPNNTPATTFTPIESVGGMDIIPNPVSGTIPPPSGTDAPSPDSQTPNVALYVEPSGQQGTSGSYVKGFSVSILRDSPAEQ